MSYDPFVPNFARIVHDMVGRRLQSYGISTEFARRVSMTKGNTSTSKKSHDAMKGGYTHWEGLSQTRGSKQDEYNDRCSLLSEGSTLVEKASKSSKYLRPRLRSIVRELFL